MSRWPIFFKDAPLDHLHIFGSAQIVVVVLVDFLVGENSINIGKKMKLEFDARPHSF